MFEIKTTPRDVFLHLLMMVMLYIGVISLITLLFAYVDYGFPDPLNFYPQGILDMIRSSSAMLVVSFPLLLILSWFIQRDFRKNQKKHELKFRKWLIYFTLLAAAITIVIDLIQLVNRFYSGDLTTPFLLKVLAVLVLAGTTFGYYVWDVQNEPHKSKIPTIVGYSASVIVVAVLVLGFLIAGSPSTQRRIRLDEQRVSDLQTLQNEIVNYWQFKNQLPTSQNQLKNDLTGFVPPRDPATQTPYQYSSSGSLTFNLCATFTLPSLFRNGSPKNTFAPSPYYNMIQPNLTWDHDAGTQCFKRTIDPALYPKPGK
ncbi:hypothetical protein HZA43_03270 [Candidatus Peregrinibacteria bacterium]|nr:hypothetical protein [Candidatus Peregrinibacteria bacterium]